MESENRALLVVSYGTAVRKAYETSVAKIEEELKAAFPDRAFYRAWTSDFVIRKVNAGGAEHVMTLSEAKDAMIKDGVRDVLIQPTHLIDGVECAKIKTVFADEENAFERVRTGRPLLDSEDDISRTAAVLADRFPGVKEGTDLLVLMGHGSPKGSGGIYERVQKAFRGIGLDNVFVGAMSGEPRFETVLGGLKQAFSDGKRGKVYLAPLLLVAGSHALKDMLGERPGTWESMLREEGFDVVPVPEGLGEFREIRGLYAAHARKEEE